MDTKILEYVIAIAEEKSLSKAAERLYLSQPALSQRLKKLEDELGTPLFLREKNGLSITDAGRIYINGHILSCRSRKPLKDFLHESQ
ncbi:MAG: LysR family transcriptional regulator [Clostridium sp.]